MTWLVALAGAYFCYAGLDAPQPLWLLGPVLLAAAWGLQTNRPWAHLIVFTTGVMMTLYIVVRLVLVEFDWYRLALLPFMIAGLRYLWVDYVASKASSSEDRPMTSLVLLQRKHRQLDRDGIAEVLSESWGGQYETDDDTEDTDEDAVRLVTGEAPIFMVCDGDGMYLVHDHDQKYFEDESAVCEALGELRMSKAVTDHQAWLSLDLMHSFSEEDPDSFYPRMAIAIADFANGDTLAIYRPDTGHINVWDEDLKKRLLDGDPVAAITEPTNVPVIPIDDDDPRMLAAAAEAHRRWPEFLEAFGKRKDGQSFSVKGPVSRGNNTEFIWISVIAVDGEFIRGNLGNDPVDLGRLRIGDEVEILTADLNDWVFEKDGEMIGLFTVKVLDESRKD